MILSGSKVLQNIPKLNSNFQMSTEKLTGLIIHWLYLEVEHGRQLDEYTQIHLNCKYLDKLP